MSKLIFKDSDYSEVANLTCKSFYFDDNVLLRETYASTSDTLLASYEYTYEIKEDRVTLTDRFDIYTQDVDKDSEQRLRTALKI